MPFDGIGFRETRRSDAAQLIVDELIEHGWWPHAGEPKSKYKGPHCMVTATITALGVLRGLWWMRKIANANGWSMKQMVKWNDRQTTVNAIFDAIDRADCR